MPKFLLIVLVCLAACSVDPAPMERAHVQRVEGINRRYDAQIAANDARWDALKKKIEGRRRFRIPVVEGTASRPTQRVEHSYQEPWAACTQAEDAASCQQDVRASYARALRVHYCLADFEWIRAQMDANADLDIEWLATKSHNAHLEQQIRNEIAELEKHEADFRGTLNGYRRDEVATSQHERDQEVESAERESSEAWAAALRGFGEGLQAASADRSPSSPQLASQQQLQVYAVPGCTSDFSCGLGQRCVKNYAHNEGVCMKAVDRNGLPSLEGPSTDSILPNLRSSKDCTALGCPIGFRCDYGSGACIK